MRTTLTIDDHLLAEAKVIAARSHRTLGSVVEEALRKLINEAAPAAREPYVLPKFTPERPGLRPGVDLEDKEMMAELLGWNDITNPKIS